jgi:hypothetical protein
MNLETRLQRLGANRGAAPTHDEWLAYMAALKRYDARPSSGRRPRPDCDFQREGSKRQPEQAAATMYWHRRQKQ